MEKRMLKPAEICTEIIDAYQKKSEYPVKKSILLGIIAGAFIAVGGFAAAAASHSVENYGIAKLIAGSIFPVGLIMILICGTDLFTGNILLSVPLIDKKIKINSVLKNWFIIYFSNFIGAFLVAFILYHSGALDGNSYKIGGYALKTAINKASLTPEKAFFSGILCNFLVCLAVWLSYASKDIIGKIFGIWFPVMAFIVSGFEHCVANMYYFSIAWLAKGNAAYAEAFGISSEKLSHLTIKNIILNNMIPATLGNIVGGSLMVGIALYAAFNMSHKKISTSSSSHQM